MKAFIRPRQMGKTKELLEMAHDTNDIIVCHKYDTARDLKRRAKQLGYNIKDPVSYSDVINGGLNNRRYGGYLLVDNADIILHTLLGSHIPIKAVTMSGVPEQNYDERLDCEQFENFRNFNPDLTWQEFCEFKYGSDI